MRIIFSGLYKRVAVIYCFLVGDADHIVRIKELLGNVGKKFKVEAEGPGDTTYERFTLQRIHGLVGDGDKFLYIHSKGVTDVSFLTQKEAKRDHIYWWRTWMEYFLIGQYDKCLEKLDTHQVVGINYSKELIGPHFSGNFWWATGSYYKTLPPSVPVSSDDPIKAYNDPEKYVFNKNPTYYDMDANRLPSNGGLYDTLLYTHTYIDSPVQTGGVLR